MTCSTAPESLSRIARKVRVPRAAYFSSVNVSSSLPVSDICVRRSDFPFTSTCVKECCSGMYLLVKGNHLAGSA